MGQDADDLKYTPLYDLHRALGGKMVPFAGYAMPVQYPAGILTEHKHTRAAAGLFDVSHMGQAWLEGDDVAATFETLVPGDIAGLAPGQIRYTLLMADDGGILDDLMVTRPIDAADGKRLFLVVNAACKDQDFAHIAARLAGKARLTRLDDRALLALQGPAAVTVMARLGPKATALTFMTAAPVDVAGIPCLVSRSGYTGEDGFEISVPADRAVDLAKALLDQPEVKPIGLGARDSLRLEAGLCLYGHDIDTTTDPIEGSLAWTVPKRRREAADFPGAARVLAALKNGVRRRRVGIKPLGRAPAREGTVVAAGNGPEIGAITSGGFGPTVEGPVAMGYVEPAHAKAGTAVELLVRGQRLPAEIVTLPFTPHRYAKA
ncbi:glycine cleavage system aminomethyltransferase GcvT [Oleomonas cavernae]|uniref:aminomethyltransferase n=1 Tax=Oleomonas cavernae TaxID=2320859 RepID=A0A418W8G7_9PROT|nr:glycine cleavage system aminomethyltransferase GcvT [Oleomonas cavernae]RJF86294.1 glycine cleavage system aminomethyltransferase GcvT [Oleomonas cavernae]